MSESTPDPNLDSVQSTGLSDPLDPVELRLLAEKVYALIKEDVRRERERRLPRPYPHLPQ